MVTNSHFESVKIEETKQERSYKSVNDKNICHSLLYYNATQETKQATQKCKMTKTQQFL